MFCINKTGIGLWFDSFHHVDCILGVILGKIRNNNTETHHNKQPYTPINLVTSQVKAVHRI